MTVIPAPGAIPAGAATWPDHGPGRRDHRPDRRRQPARPGLARALRRPLEGTGRLRHRAVSVMAVPATMFGAAVDLGAIYGASLFRGRCCAAGNSTPRSGQTSRAAAGGAGAAYLRRVWEVAGGFPEWPRFGADPLFVEKANRSGVRFAFAPGARIAWQLGPGLWRIVERHYRHQFSRFRAFAPWPVLVRRSLPASVLAALTCAGLLQPWFFAVAGLAFLAETPDSPARPCAPSRPGWPGRRTRPGTRDGRPGSSCPASRPWPCAPGWRPHCAGWPIWPSLRKRRARPDA